MVKFASLGCDLANIETIPLPLFGVMHIDLGSTSWASDLGDHSCANTSFGRTPQGVNYPNIDIRMAGEHQQLDLSCRGPTSAYLTCQA